MDEPRYAIYFVPPANSDLHRFGAGFLGYDCYTGEDARPTPASIRPPGPSLRASRAGTDFMRR